MPTVADLGQKIKAKFPGSYDDVPDDQLGLRAQAKHPGSYDDFSPAPATVPVPAGLRGPPPMAPWGMPSSLPHKTFADTFGHDTPAGKTADFLSGVSDFLPSAETMIGASAPAVVRGVAAPGILRRAMGVGGGMGTEWAVEHGLRAIGVPTSIARTVASAAGIGVGSRFGHGKTAEGPMEVPDIGTTAPSAKIPPVNPISPVTPFPYFAESGTALPPTPIAKGASSPGPLTPIGQGEMIPANQALPNVAKKGTSVSSDIPDIEQQRILDYATKQRAQKDAAMASYFKANNIGPDEIRKMGESEYNTHVKAAGKRPSTGVGYSREHSLAIQHIIDLMSK